MVLIDGISPSIIPSLSITIKEPRLQAVFSLGLFQRGAHHLVCRAHGKAGNGNWKRKLEMETGNGNRKQMGAKHAPVTGAMFSS